MKEILPNLYNIRVPLPRNPLEYVNCYVVRNDERSLIVDTGLNMKECKDALSDGLNRLGIDLAKTDVFVTHFHEDHIGLVPYLATDTLTIHFSKVEADIAAEYLAEGSQNPWWSKHSDFLRTHGFSEDALQTLAESHPDSGYEIKGRLNIRTLKEGDAIDIGDYSFTCIETPGHSPGHICLFERERGVFVSGDHILGGITPNIALWSEEVNPLKDYIASLEKVQNLDVERVLPGHGKVFENFRRRVQELKDHHQERADEILRIVGKGAQSALQIASQMTWDMPEPWDEFPPSQKWFACGEALAHLKYLEGEGRIQRQIREQRILFSLQ